MKITQRRLKQIIREEIETALDEGGCGDHVAPEVMVADDEPVHSDNPLDASAQIIADLMGQQEEPMMYEADDEKDEEYVDPKVDPYERALEAPLQEKEDDNWIQDAEKDIERRGTEGVCTGKNFGSEKCPPGSKRYNLAKTFRKMAKDRKK